MSQKKQALTKGLKKRHSKKTEKIIQGVLDELERQRLAKEKKILIRPYAKI